MMSNVILHGKLGEIYGKEHRFDLSSVAQAVSALSANYKSFAKDFRDGFYYVKLADTFLEDEALLLPTSRNNIHIIPTVEGARGKGGIKAIAGVALLAVATGGAATAGLPWLTGAAAVQSGLGATAMTLAGFEVSYGSLALTGASMLLSGVASMMTPVPSTNYSNRNPVDQRASFLFGSATNRSAEGTPIPLVYGQFRVGSVVASAGLTVEQIL